MAMNSASNSGYLAGKGQNKGLAGRGSHFNLKNRFEMVELEPLYEEPPEGQTQRTQILPEKAKSILSYNQSPDVPFNLGINPYRGCEHGCSYCFARPSHEYLGYSSGLDFESKIVAKTNAARLLEKELSHKNYKSQPIALSGNTDCYQPIEKKMLITRQCLQVLSKYKNPVAVITKNYLVTRDIDILEQMSEWNGAAVFISITTLDDNLRKKMEPRTSPVALRLKAIETLVKAGVSVGVLLAPLIPGLTDNEMPQILKTARERGASHASYILLRLPHGVKELFSNWLDVHYPQHAQKIIHRIQDLRNGKLYNSDFSSRMKGEGVWARQFQDMFSLYQKKYDFKMEKFRLNHSEFIVPQLGQQSLF